MTRFLDGDVIVVTGSSRGIGRAIARRCAAEGARVVVTARTPAHGNDAVDQIRRAGGTAIYVPADVSVEADVERLFTATVEEWGKVDGIVCNAATLDLGALDGPVTEITLDGWSKILTADLTSVFLTAKHGLKAIMRGQAGGSMVAISSMAGMRGNIGHDAYSAAKGGIVALNRAISAYYSRYGIRCNCLSVGFVDSGADRIEQYFHANPQYRSDLQRFHLGLLGQPDDIAGITVLLLSDDARYISGAHIPVDGGASAASHLPRPTVGDIEGFAPIVANPARFGHT